MTARRHHPVRRRQAGLSIVELLTALSISAMLLTATTVALNASIHAYATAAETASTQSGSRIVMQRVLSMIRTGDVHDAYDPDDNTVTLGQPALAPVQTVGIQMLETDGTLIRVYWQANEDYDDADLGDLMYQEGGDPMALLTRVRALRDADDEPYIFSLASRDSDDGLLLARATLDLSVEPGADATLSMESARGQSADVRLVGSTMPRRNFE